MDRPYTAEDMPDLPKDFITDIQSEYLNRIEEYTGRDIEQVDEGIGDRLEEESEDWEKLLVVDGVYGETTTWDQPSEYFNQEVADERIIGSMLVIPGGVEMREFPSNAEQDVNYSFWTVDAQNSYQDTDDMEIPFTGEWKIGVDTDLGLGVAEIHDFRTKWNEMNRRYENQR